MVFSNLYVHIKQDLSIEPADMLCQQIAAEIE